MLKKLKIETFLVGILLLVILSFLVLLPKTASFQASPEQLSIGILLDLLITIPVIYFLFIRKTKIPKSTILYTFIGCIFLAGFILPPEQQTLVSNVQYILIPLVELGILGMLIYKIRSLNKSFRSQQDKEFDFYDKLVLACTDIFSNRVGRLLATEISVIYYLFSFKKDKEVNDTTFTYFEKSGIKTVIYAVLFLVVAETVVVHLLVSKYNPTIALVLTLLGLYVGLQIVAIVRSLSKRLITIDFETDTLHLKYGFACQTSIPFNCIEKIEDTKKSFSSDKGNTQLSIFDLLDTHNLTVFLNKPLILYKIYGMQKEYTSISFFIDEKDVFVNSIQGVIEEREK